MPVMNKSGMKTATSETLRDTTVNPICFAPLRAASSGAIARFDVTHDILNHHNRIVDDEAGRDGQRHQGKIIEAESGQIHDAECADE